MVLGAQNRPTAGPVAAVASVLKRCEHAQCHSGGGAHGVWAESRGALRVPTCLFGVVENQQFI